MDAKFQVVYVDKTTFNGDLFRKDWGKVENKEIIALSFDFGGKIVKLEGYMEYNLTYETHSVVGKGNRIDNITVAGRKVDSSDLIVYNFKNGKLEKKEVQKYTEYGNMIVTTWKQGIKNATPKAYHG